jgi:ankyrin repeat protein
MHRFNLSYRPWGQNNMTALIYAAQHGRTEVTDLLLQFKVSVNDQDQVVLSVLKFAGNLPYITKWLVC